MAVDFFYFQNQFEGVGSYTADQLYNDPDRGEELRKTVIEYMADNRNVSKAILPLRDAHGSQTGELALCWDEDAQFDEYLRLLARDETWGGDSCRGRILRRYHRNPSGERSFLQLQR